jgi:hypothetical protein
MTPALVFQDRSFLPLWHYGWFQVTAFTVIGSAEPWDDAVVIAALLAHPRYGVSYAVPIRHDHGGQAIHGPFVLARIQPSDFQALSVDDLRAHMDTVMRDPEMGEPPDQSQQAAVRAQVDALLTATSRVLWLDMPLTETDYHHDLSSIHDVFVEYIIIDPVAQTLAVCVIGYD